jgi:hypothetical protein
MRPLTIPTRVVIASSLLFLFSKKRKFIVGGIFFAGQFDRPTPKTEQQ